MGLEAREICGSVWVERPVVKMQHRADVEDYDAEIIRDGLAKNLKMIVDQVCMELEYVENKLD
jgi:hypothetical protein